MANAISVSTPAPLPLWRRLYVRIWLAVVLAVAALTLLVSWAWRLTAEAPLREVHIRNADGVIIGVGLPRRPRAPPAPPMPGMEAGPGRGAPDGLARPGGPGRTATRHGPEFTVVMNDGRLVHVHLPRPPDRSPFANRQYGFLWLLALVGVAVALATYPLIRQLTRRLEALQGGVERWGQGELGARVAVQGNDEVAALARRFNHAAARIEELVGAHKNLLANASHELRSPLTRIRMGLELMGERPSPGFKDEIARNISELDQLIAEILLASRLDTREADMGTVESVDLTGLVAEECAHADAELQTSDAVQVQGVVKLLRRLVRNLLENARRYSSGAVEVTLQTQEKRVLLRVSDHGPGVPEDLRARIFEPFYRLPGASEQSGGVGLGLALVKSITERHGGQVRCEARPDGASGASFVVELPV